MSVDYTQLMTALEAGNYQQLEGLLIGHSLADMVEIGLLIGPDRLREVSYRIDRRYRDRAPFSTPRVVPPSPPRTQSTGREYTIDVLAATLHSAYGEVIAGRTRDDVALALRTEVAAAVTRIATERGATQVVRITRDVTRTLPTPLATVPRLTEADFVGVATRHGVESRAVRAVATVESGGRSGFDDRNRPKILMEGHKFRHYTNAKFDRTHPHLSKPYPRQRPFYRWNQYARMYEALLLAPVAAVQSASWGMFQVMGFNHNGWPDPVSFAVAMFAGEGNHLRSFEAYCTANGVWRPLTARNWAGVARAYNGADYATNDYDGQMLRAYNALAPRPGAR